MRDSCKSQQEEWMKADYNLCSMQTFWELSETRKVTQRRKSGSFYVHKTERSSKPVTFSPAAIVCQSFSLLSVSKKQDCCTLKTILYLPAKLMRTYLYRENHRDTNYSSFWHSCHIYLIWTQHEQITSDMDTQKKNKT